MDLGARIVAARMGDAARKGGALLARPFARLGEACRRWAAQEREFYRTFEGYCRANNVSPICVEGWKSRGWRQN
jgi:hypothetical protein